MNAIGTQLRDPINSGLARWRMVVQIVMDAAAELRRNSVSKHQIQPEYGMSRRTRDETAESSRETKFSGANGDGEILIFPVQLTTSRFGSITRLILTLAICDDHTYDRQQGR